MMPFSHVALALLVMVLWGLNFVMIHLGVQDISPFVLCSLRFFLASVPLVFFIKKPSAPFSIVLSYGLITFALQYVLLFSGMKLGMPAGLASILYQTQVFFAIILAGFVFKEKPTSSQILGTVIAFSGIGVILFNLGGNITLMGFLLTIAAAVTWAFGNIISKRVGSVNMLSLVVWGNFVSWPPVLILTFMIEGIGSIQHLYQHLSWVSGGSILYIAYISTLFCFSIWSWLLHRYPVAVVVPFTLSVPVFSMLSSYIISDEPLLWWKIIAAILIMIGLAINLLGLRLSKMVWIKEM